MGCIKDPNSYFWQQPDSLSHPPPHPAACPLMHRYPGWVDNLSKVISRYIYVLIVCHLWSEIILVSALCWHSCGVSCCVCGCLCFFWSQKLKYEGLGVAYLQAGGLDGRRGLGWALMLGKASFGSLCHDDLELDGLPTRGKLLVIYIADVAHTATRSHL